MASKQTLDVALLRYLDPDEKLLWAGKPKQGIILRPQDIYLVPFSFMVTAFTLFWEYSVIKIYLQVPQPTGVFMIFWGIPFILFGLYLLLGRLLVDARSRATTYYGVTDDHVVIIKGIFTREALSWQLRTLSDFALTERADGSGSIVFGRRPFMFLLFPPGAWPGASWSAPPSFDMIQDARKVYDIIRLAQKKI